MLQYAKSYPTENKQVNNNWQGITEVYFHGLPFHLRSNATRQFIKQFQNTGDESLENLCFYVKDLIDTATVGDLHDIFAPLVESIFDTENNRGWNLCRITEKQNDEFITLRHFFDVVDGPMFRLCYHLRNYRYELPVSLLPYAMQDMVRSEGCPAFYREVLSFDKLSHTKDALFLNPFDYFFFHFAHYGTIPQVIIDPRWNSNNQKRPQTIYNVLAADYMCNFLPNKPFSEVFPQMTMPSKEVCSLIYPTMFLLPGNGAHDTSSQRTPATAEIYQYGHWRSRSVMFILLDMWLRLDVNPVVCHPDPLSCTLSIELLTNIRALVKQIHKFSSINTDLDFPAIRKLRSEAQQQLKERIEPFLWQLMCHWPLDESLKELLEVWLSYIQPWRYRIYRDSKQLMQFQTMFIADNISAYTQPLVHLLLRFSKYDPAHPSFWRPLHRVCTVFNQHDLARIIRSYDKIETEKSQLENYTTIYGTHYCSMFSDSSPEMELLMDQLGSRIKFLRHMLTFGNHYDSWSNQLLHFVYKLLQLYTLDQQEMLLLHSRLEFIYNVLTEKLNAPARQGLLNDSKNKSRTARNGFWMPGFFGNPDLIPVTSTENAMLVRTFHRLSERLNIMFESKLYVIWLSETVWCALVRQVLEPPVTFYTYVRNTKRQREKQRIYLGPRISFRFLASYRNIAYVLLAILLGVVLYGSPFFGLQILMLLSFVRIVLRAIFFPQ